MCVHIIPAPGCRHAGLKRLWSKEMSKTNNHTQKVTQALPRLSVRNAVSGNTMGPVVFIVSLQPTNYIYIRNQE